MNFSTAIKRVLRDLAEVEKEPIQGIALCMPDIADPFTLHGNIEIKDGLYEGCLIHLIVHIPEEYPIKPPAVNIAPGLKFGHRHHEHIFDDELHGNSICTDLTSNFAGFFSVIDSSGKPVQSGWTPSYTLSSVLMQLQVFFADPDLPQHMLPSSEEIKKLKDHITYYKLDIKVNDGKEDRIVTHSYNNPYPPLKSNVIEESLDISDNIKTNIQEEKFNKTNSGISPTLNQNVSTATSPFSSEKKESFELEEHKKEEKASPEKKKSEVIGWDKPLKKLPKTSGIASNSANTVVIKVIKQMPKIESESLDIPPPTFQQKGYKQKNGLPRRNNYAYNNQPNNGYRASQRRFQDNNKGFRLEKAYQNNENISQTQRASNFNQRRVENKNKNEEETKIEIEELNSPSNTEWGKVLKRQSKDKKNNSQGYRTQTISVSTSKNNHYEGNQNQSVGSNISLYDRIETTHSNRIAKEAEQMKLQRSAMFGEKVDYQTYVSNDKKTETQIKNEVKAKLICSISKADIFDSSKPVLGYPIDLEKDQFGRLWPTPLMEVLSYDSFVFNIQQDFQKLDNYHRVKFTSSFGMSYNYWLPVYIDDEHFERSKQHIVNSIAIIYAGVEGKKENDFRPEMVLKVLPPILVKTAIHFLKGTIYQSIAGIDTYCQIYRLLVKFIEIFPELQIAIDKEVEDFCAREENRHKRVAGDLGEFIIKLTLSTKGINDSSIINLLVKEHLTRQVSWALRKDRNLYRKNGLPNFVEKFMTATEISNQFFLVKLETAKLLLDEHVKKDMDRRCGLLNDEVMKVFRARLNWIQKNMKNDWQVFVEGAGQLGYVYNDQVMLSYILKAFDMASFKGYLFGNQ